MPSPYDAYPLDELAGRVAAAIIAAIKKNKLRTRVGPDAFVGDWLKRAFPTGDQRLLARFLKKSMR